MWPFKKKQNSELVLQDKKLVEDILQLIVFFKDTLKGNEEAKSILAEVEDKLKYANPSGSKDVYNADEKIFNRLSDYKIVVQKASQSNTVQDLSLDELRNLRTQVLDRNSKL